MIEAAKVDNLDKYKSYIQRRRVGPDPNEANETAQPVIRLTEPLMDYDFDTKEEVRIESDKRSALQDFLSDETGASTVSSSGTTGTKRASTSIHDLYSAPDSTTRRTDLSLYRRLYGQNHKNTHNSPYASTHHGYGSSNHAEIEDNRATVLAVKIIKQALTCFAVLGIIVLMQQRSDMDSILTFIKKQVVDTHIEPKSLLTGIENVWKEASRFLGGSP